VLLQAIGSWLSPLLGADIASNWSPSGRRLPWSSRFVELDGIEGVGDVWGLRRIEKDEAHFHTSDF